MNPVYGNRKARRAKSVARKERRGMFVLASSFSIAQLAYEIGGTADFASIMFAMLIGVSCRTVVVRSVTGSRDSATFIIWLFIELSLIVWPLLGIDRFDPENVRVAYEAGLLSLLVYTFVLILLIPKHLSRLAADIRGAGHSNRSDFRWIGVSRTFHANLFMFLVPAAFAATALAAALGMTSVASGGFVALPYKLGGLLTYFRNIGVSVLTLIIVDMAFERRQRKLMTLVLIFYILWAVFEAYIGLSKGKLLIFVVPLFLWALSRHLVTRRLFLLGLGFLLANVIIYFAMLNYRSNLLAGLDVSFIELFATYTVDIYSGQMDSMEVARGPFERTLSAGVDIVGFVPHMQDFYWSGIWNDVAAEGGSAKYNTRIVYQIPETVAFSAGISGLSDAFVLGGMPLVAGTVGLLTLFARWGIDRGSLFEIGSTEVGKALGTMFIFSAMIGGFWNLYFKGLFPMLVWPAVFVIHAYLARAGRFQK